MRYLIWTGHYLSVRLSFANERCLMYQQVLLHGVFTRVLRGLADAVVIRPNPFRSVQDGHGVKCSVNAENRLLYQHGNVFFLPKFPPLTSTRKVVST